jgi:phytoene dehydrogenase-like protein
VCVLERREVVGGASITEEIFPGYRFTEFSYVVSLLRPEIIRDLELPRHGLKILPLPSTVTPMDNGEYLAAWDDHDLTARSSTGTRRATPRPRTNTAPDGARREGDQADHLDGAA